MNREQIAEEEARTARSIETPEGVPLLLRLADRGQRATAYIVDSAIWMGALFVIAILAGLAVSGDSSGWLSPFLLVSAFLLRNFYFTWFELRWRGRTPGKRSLKLRVVDRSGGPLTSRAVVARNLMREVEVFLPMTLLIGGETVWPSAPGWATLVAALWALGLLFWPCFNRDRLRIGDLVGGTMVVREPRQQLLPDIGAEAAYPRRGRRFEFTSEQLAFYGIYELQVLERVLRQEPGPARDTALASVAESVKRKIGWQAGSPNVDDELFLADFYAAQRRHLEHGKLLGAARADKFARRESGGRRKPR